MSRHTHAAPAASAVRTGSVVDTDMRPFEGALDENWCHVVDDGEALCGGPLASAASALHESDPGPVCTGCGRRSCPDCQRIWEQGR